MLAVRDASGMRGAYGGWRWVVKADGKWQDWEEMRKERGRGEKLVQRAADVGGKRSKPEVHKSLWRELQKGTKRIWAWGGRKLVPSATKVNWKRRVRGVERSRCREFQRLLISDACGLWAKVGAESSWGLVVSDECDGGRMLLPEDAEVGVGLQKWGRTEAGAWSCRSWCYVTGVGMNSGWS